MLLSPLMPVQNEPCNKVSSGEAQAHEQVLPVSERDVHAWAPAGFENAARKEHHNEAAALRNIHEQGVCPASSCQAFGVDMCVCTVQKSLKCSVQPTKAPDLLFGQVCMSLLKWCTCTYRLATM